MRECRLMGVGAYRATREVGSAEVAGWLGVDEQWVRARCGVRSRRYAEPTETLESMAHAAAKEALARAQIDPDQVECVVVATGTNLRQMPAVAPEVAYRLGAVHAAAFDLSAACAGFSHSLAVVRAMVLSGTVRHALVVAAERMTDIVDVTDRSMGPLFGDGAGAVVVGPAAVWGIGPAAWGADGGQADVLAMSASWDDYATEKDLARPTLRMDGRRLARWVRADVVPALRRAVQMAGVEVDDLAAFIPHQANLRIIDMLAESLHLPAHVVVARDVVTAGNTSAASIPLAMHALLDSGQAASGDLALLGGYGAGLNYSAQVVRLP